MSKLEKVHTKVRPDMTRLPDFASILIVDDQRFDRTRLQRLIATLEFDTHVVEAEGLERMGTMLEADKFDLILLDYNLTDGNGLQALEAVRLSAKNRNAATIMIAGEGQADIAIEALKRGCSDYITKDDLTPEAFRRASINALQKSHLTAGIETQDNRRREIETVLQRFSTECAGEIKPVVSRMMRQLRELRDTVDMSVAQKVEHHQRIERSCMRLWDFLNDLEAYEGTDLAGTSAALQADGSGGASGVRPAADDHLSAGPRKVVPERVTATRSKKTFWRPDR